MNPTPKQLLTKERDSANADLRQLHIQHDALQHLYDALAKDLARMKTYEQHLESRLHEVDKQNNELRIEVKSARADEKSAQQEHRELLQQYNSLRSIVAKLDGYVTRIQEMEDRKFLAEHPTMVVPRQQEMVHPNLHIFNHLNSGVQSIDHTFDWLAHGQQRNKS